MQVTDLTPKQIAAQAVCYQRTWNALNRDHKKRDINGDIVEMRMTFWEWLTFWVESGHLFERGAHHGEYCMSRINDVGHYELGNVFIQLTTQNSKDVATATRRRIGLAASAKPGVNEQRSKSHGGPNEEQIRYILAYQGKISALVRETGFCRSTIDRIRAYERHYAKYKP